MRARRSRQQWEKIIGTFERSGQTLARFCTPRGIRPDTLKWWQWQLHSSSGVKASPADRPDGVRLVAVDVVTRADAPVTPTTLAILVAGAELRVEAGMDVGYVSELVVALRSRC
jgi:hypothetical protein